MLSHLSLGVSDMARSAAFYDALLAPLGLGRSCSFPDGHHVEVKLSPQRPRS